MSKRNIIFLVLMVILGGIALVSPDGIVKSISLLATVIILMSMKLIDFMIKNRLVNQIKKDNRSLILVKENNKWMILIAAMMITSMVTGIKARVNIFKMESSNISMTNFINNLDGYEKWTMFASIILIIIAIFIIAEVLFSCSVLTNDKVIFYDGVVFDIDKIEEVKYKDLILSKSKKIIKVGKGIIGREIIVSVEEFDKVKCLLKEKNS